MDQKEHKVRKDLLDFQVLTDQLDPQGLKEDHKGLKEQLVSKVLREREEDKVLKGLKDLLQ
jgi:hypothetical protein